MGEHQENKPFQPLRDAAGIPERREITWHDGLVYEEMKPTDPPCAGMLTLAVNDQVFGQSYRPKHRVELTKGRVRPSEIREVMEEIIEEIRILQSDSEIKTANAGVECVYDRVI